MAGKRRKRPGPDAGGGVAEWLEGLPTAADDLTPLSQTLITPELASAFGVTPERNRTILDVHRASQETIASLRGHEPGETSSSSAALERFRDDADPHVSEDEGKEGEDEKDEASERGDGTTGGKGGTKRPRLVWTPQLHKRFVEVVAHLGLKNSVPKTIMNLMNVEGLTRENVASHLQKYRLYLKRMRGIPDEDISLPSSSTDRLLAPNPVSRTSREGLDPGMSGMMPMPPLPGAIPMPVIGVPPQHVNGGHLTMMPAANRQFDSVHHSYAFLEQQSGERPGGVSKSGSVFSNPHVAPADE